MTAQFVLTMGRDALTLLLMVALPVLGTVIHEATLAFVPKLVAAVVVFAIAGPWMLTTLVDYLRRTIEAIPTVVG
jgi:flagellar biosynthetic protein FliQ